MALVVDRYELGPIGTNCYVVRSERGAPEAAVVDPSGDAATIRLELAGMGATCAGILVTHSHWDHILGLAELAEGTGVKVYGPEVEVDVLENPANYYSGLGVSLRGWKPDVLLAGGETIEVAGISFEVVAVPGHSPGHLAYYADGALLSGDVLFAGSVGRTDLPRGDWDVAARVDQVARRALSRRRRSSTPATARRRRSATSSQRNPFLTELRGVMKFEAPRGTHDILPSEQPLWALVISRVRRAVRALRLSADPDAGLRGHRALRPHLGPRARTWSRRRCTRSPTAATAR